MGVAAQKVDLVAFREPTKATKSFCPTFGIFLAPAHEPVAFLCVQIALAAMPFVRFSPMGSLW